MIDHVQNRKIMIQALREEFVGPAPRGEEVDCSGPIEIQGVIDLYKSCRQKGSGEEILTRESPQIRYTAGVLFPYDLSKKDAGDLQTSLNLTDEQNEESENLAPEKSVPDPLTQDGLKDIQNIEKILVESHDKSDSGNLDITLSNSYRPSSVAVSFLAHVGKGAVLNVRFTAGRYTQKEVTHGSRKNIWWLRTPVGCSAEFDLKSALRSGRTKLNPKNQKSENLGNIKISIEVFVRPAPNGQTDSRLITVCVINRSEVKGIQRELSVFQCGLTANVVDDESSFNILPYPKPSIASRDEEEESLDLLYRHHETFAVGHGCSADWGEVIDSRRVEWVKSESLPVTETPNITPDLTKAEGEAFSVSMAAMAGLVANNDGFNDLRELITMYKNWIDEREAEARNTDDLHKSAAENHISQCRAFLGRMKTGLDHLSSDPLSMRAFRLANRAILIQQLRSRRSSRIPEFDQSLKRLVFSEAIPKIDELAEHSGRGRWRAFQIAFILAAVKSMADGRDAGRDIVDLIWFPTGGGKTEAYLGIAAFAILMRRLKNPEDSGVEVLMRYTLRLLTAQQFLRASGLICALESIRRENVRELGEKEISIGVWLGGETTPNSKRDAVAELRSLKKGKKHDNPFMVERCPWCGAMMGPQEYTNRSNKAAPKLPGYEEAGGTIKFKCPDGNCDFADGLPLYVIDEDLYESPPSLVIGTVDKFAVLTWKAEARALFGIDQNGLRMSSPPGLIIQDELHLISGPLGSMVGLYEALVEELCTDKRNGSTIKPKIVCSTATIRRSSDQIKALFGRSNSALFPPPGLEASDSFFARFARDENGKLLPGKAYVGLMTPGATFDTAVAQTMASLLQAPMSLEKEARDPWWTLVTFYNTLRELGTGLSLLQSHVPDHIRTILSRSNLSPNHIRRLYNIQELTGRLKSGEVARSIGKLEVEVSANKDVYPVDVCLTSSIMEVGVDIDRLSLMMVVGQPKSTSQYIQITGRVGRKWDERPGLIVTIYPPSRPRDRSHFEKFRSYHERLYAQVEPTSVTPFSPPAIERGLHAVMAGYVLQFGDEQNVDSPHPFPEELVQELKSILDDRVAVVNEGAQSNFEKVFKRRSREWEKWERTKWSGSAASDDAPLLRPAGGYINPAFARISWPTPTSMRNVDAECQTDVYLGVLNEEVDNDAA